jgi:hypothetical protein
MLKTPNSPLKMKIHLENFNAKQMYCKKNHCNLFFSPHKIHRRKFQRYKNYTALRLMLCRSFLRLISCDQVYCNEIFLLGKKHLVNFFFGKIFFGELFHRKRFFMKIKKTFFEIFESKWNFLWWIFVNFYLQWI